MKTLSIFAENICKDPNSGVAALVITDDKGTVVSASIDNHNALLLITNHLKSVVNFNSESLRDDLAVITLPEHLKIATNITKFYFIKMFEAVLFLSSNDALVKEDVFKLLSLYSNDNPKQDHFNPNMLQEFVNILDNNYSKINKKIIFSELYIKLKKEGNLFSSYVKLPEKKEYQQLSDVEPDYDLDSFYNETRILLSESVSLCLLTALEELVLDIASVYGQEPIVLFEKYKPSIVTS